MARRYRLGPLRRAANAAIASALRAGVPIPGTFVLTTLGRRSRRPRSTPVYVMSLRGERWLVAPYGARGWVQNVRASGEAELRRGRRRVRVHLEEVEPATAAPVLRRYLRLSFPVTGAYFDVRPWSGLAEFEGEAPRHPVFRVVDEVRAS